MHSVSFNITIGITVNMIQGLSVKEGVIDFDLRKQKSFRPEQIYPVLSRVKT